MEGKWNCAIMICEIKESGRLLPFGAEALLVTNIVFLMT